MLGPGYGACIVAGYALQQVALYASPSRFLAQTGLHALFVA